MIGVGNLGVIVAEALLHLLIHRLGTIVPAGIRLEIRVLFLELVGPVRVKKVYPQEKWLLGGRAESSLTPWG